jgi:Ca-activated chloride channel family protein
MGAPAPAAEAPADFDDVFGGGAKGRMREKAKPAEPSKALESIDGTTGIAVSKKVGSMKNEELANKQSEPVRSASGRTFLFRMGGWIDSEAVNGTPKQLKVKYLSDAYFAVLKARPDLKAALALGNRVVIVVSKDKSLVITPDEGETKADKLTDFLK